MSIIKKNAIVLIACLNLSVLVGQNATLGDDSSQYIALATGYSYTDSKVNLTLNENIFYEVSRNLVLGKGGLVAWVGESTNGSMLSGVISENGFTGTLKDMAANTNEIYLQNKKTVISGDDEGSNSDGGGPDNPSETNDDCGGDSILCEDLLECPTDGNVFHLAIITSQYWRSWASSSHLAGSYFQVVVGDIQSALYNSGIDFPIAFSELQLDYTENQNIVQNSAGNDRDYLRRLYLDNDPDVINLRDIFEERGIDAALSMIPPLPEPGQLIGAPGMSDCGFGVSVHPSSIASIRGEHIGTSWPIAAHEFGHFFGARHDRFYEQVRSDIDDGCRGAHFIGPTANQYNANAGTILCVVDDYPTFPFVNRYSDGDIIPEANNTKVIKSNWCKILNRYPDGDDVNISVVSIGDCLYELNLEHEFVECPVSENNEDYEINWSISTTGNFDGVSPLIPTDTDNLCSQEINVNSLVLSPCTQIFVQVEVIEYLGSSVFTRYAYLVLDNFDCYENQDCDIVITNSTTEVFDHKSLCVDYLIDILTSLDQNPNYSIVITAQQLAYNGYPDGPPFEVFNGDRIETYCGFELTVSILEEINGEFIEVRSENFVFPPQCFAYCQPPDDNGGSIGRSSVNSNHKGMIVESTLMSTTDFYYFSTDKEIAHIIVTDLMGRTIWEGSNASALELFMRNANYNLVIVAKIVEK